MPLYRIKSNGGTHRRLEGKEMVVYGNRGRDGERDVIELTTEQFASGVFDNLELSLVDTTAGVHGDGDPKPDDDGLDTMKVADLRALAELHGVELAKEDNRKDEIIAKLRASGVKGDVK